VFSFNRQKDPATRAPYAWRAGKIKELRAPDPYTVEYELNEPNADLLVQLSMFNNAIHNKDSLDQWGKDYGIKGIDGTGPWCFVSWTPRTEIVLKRHDAYRWGPSMYKNPGPVKFERLVIRIVPEDSSRLAAMMGGRFDITTHFPVQFIEQAKKAPKLNVEQAKPNFQLMYYGFKANRPLVSDKRVREAMSIAINRSEIVKGAMLGQADPAYTYIEPAARDHNPATRTIVKEDVNRAKKLLDEAGWKPGPDGIRVKDGVRLAPLVYIPQVSYFPRVSEAIQGYMRKIGIDWKIERLRQHDRAGRAEQAGLRALDRDLALPLVGRAAELLLRLQEHAGAQPHELEGRQTDEYLKSWAAPRSTDADRAYVSRKVQQR
jgi:peptide/nickel transport system substrate-binding protein